MQIILSTQVVIRHSGRRMAEAQKQKPRRRAPLNMGSQNSPKPTMNMRKPKPKVISLYTGAGGLDIGLEAAGFDISLCVEIEQSAQATLRANRPKWKLAIPSDVHQLLEPNGPEAVLEQAGLVPGEATLLAGGPPCQPFSKAGFWVRGDAQRLSDPRAKTLHAYLQIVATCLPEVVLLENVEGLSYQGKTEGRTLLERELAKINRQSGSNYRPTFFTINAAAYGVPQSRVRVFMIAHREGKLFTVPQATHFPPDGPDHLQNGKDSFRTCWDAIGDLDPVKHSDELNPTGKWAKLLPSIPEGENYLWHTPGSGGLPLFGWRTRYWSFLLKLAKDMPSWTIQAQPGPATGPFHWRNRKLSIRELCRLQTFPDDYRIQGSYRAAYQQIGNAVPPLIGELLGLEIRRQFLGHRCRKKLRLAIPSQPETPPRTPNQAVPHEYLPLVGDHKPHPGVGRGPRASERNDKEAGEAAA